MSLTQFLKPEMIWIKSTCSSSTELFEEVTEQGKQLHLIMDNFLEKIIARECEFPTGLQIDKYGIAIPHTDPECIKKQFIAVITTDNPISFSAMEDKNQSVDASVIFVLGLNEPHCQLAVLQQLMRTIQDENNISALLEATQPSDVIHILKNISVNSSYKE